MPKNAVEPMRWYVLAAEPGYADAQFNLGAMYANGHGVQQNYVEADKWLSLAAAQGHSDAAKWRDIVRGQIGQRSIGGQSMGDAIIGLFENTMLLNGFVMLGLAYVSLRAEASPPKPTDSPGSASRKGYWRLLKWAGLIVGSVSLLIGLIEIM